MQILIKNSRVEELRSTLAEVNQWLKGQVLCTLATLDKTGAPMVATVAFSVTEAGELLVGTKETSRKSQNIDGDERVAVVVTDSEARITVQIEGTARKLSQDDFDQNYAEEHYRQRPESLPFRDVPGQAHILITPSHVRHSNCRPYPWEVTEFDC